MTATDPLYGHHSTFLHQWPSKTFELRPTHSNASPFVWTPFVWTSNVTHHIFILHCPGEHFAWTCAPIPIPILNKYSSIAYGARNTPKQHSKANIKSMNIKLEAYTQLIHHLEDFPSYSARE